MVHQFKNPYRCFPFLLLCDPYQDQQVKRPGVLDLRNLSEWEAKTSAQVNEKARAQVEEANKRADKAQNLALENAAAKDQVRVLQKQLSTSEELKEDHYGKLVDAAKRAAGGEPASPALIKQGGELLDKAVQDVQQSRERIVELHAKADQAEKGGDWFGKPIDIWYGSIPKEQAHQMELETVLRGYKGGAERLNKLDEEQVKAAADKVEQAKKDEEEQVRKALHKEIIAQGDRERAQKTEALRVQKHELALMDTAFEIYQRKVRPDELLACLIVQDKLVKQVEDAFGVQNMCWVDHLGVRGEPRRED